MISLKDQQAKIPVNVVSYDLDKVWGTSTLISDLRKKVISFLPENKLYDPQDLEHQVLFRLTTFDPKTINDELIKFIISEQLKIVENRLDKVECDLHKFFRGLTSKYHDLNVSDRLSLCWEGNKLVARNKHRLFNVEFKEIHDERIVSLFSSDFHYIHHDRPRGESFGFYFSGDDMPWAIETTEPSVIAKQYKRDALLANGIDPNKAIELTRFYTLPGAPVNAISLMDGLIAKHYKTRGVEALFTTTMPMYSKTKSTTIAGGINKPLLVKDLRHKFVPVKIGNDICYQHVTTIPKDPYEGEVIKTHPNFPTMLVVEVFRLINNPSLDPLPILNDNNKVIYVAQRENSLLEQEIKLPIADIPQLLNKIRGVASYARTEYMRDIIYGRNEDKKKIRLRIFDDFIHQECNAVHKYRISVQDGIKREVEETVYKGNSFEDALVAIKGQGEFKEENSYEKTRILFMAENGTEITVDIYPFGAWIEVEGIPENIHYIAKHLGYSEKDYIALSADDLYLEWIKKHNLPEMWDIRFGMTGKK
jgi:adenylate cyclase class IV